MPERPEDPTNGQPDLAAALRHVAHQIAVPPQPPYATHVEQRLGSLEDLRRLRTGANRRDRRDRMRPLVAAAVALLAIIAVTLSIPAARDAVADLFGLAGVRVRPLPSSAPTPATTLDASLDLGEAVSLAEARHRVSFPVGLPSAAGLEPTDAVYVRQERGLESVSLVYRPRAGFPQVLDAQVGLLLSEYAGSATPYFDKLVADPSSVERVTVAGRWPGLYFPEPHELLIRDSHGEVHFERARLSTPTLVWVQGPVTYRLEANIGLQRALAVAAALG